MSARKKKKRFGKKLAVAAVIIAVLAVLVGSKLSGGNKVQPVKTVKPRIGAVVERLTETGNIELLRSVEVKSKIAGTIQSILVKEGDEVRQGQVLCVVDPDPTQTLLLFQKRSAVDRAKIELDQARKELDRKRELAKTALVSTKELEDALNSHRIIQNTYSLSLLELEIMEREIETTGTGTEERIVSSKVRAPISGVITQRYVEEGVLVTSGISSFNAGKDLFQIGDPSAQIIRANISEVDIGKVKVGIPVRITLDAYPDTSFAGWIRHISPVGKLQEGRNVVAFNTEVEISDKDPRLKPGMSCDVDVILAEEDSVLYLPLEAVYRKQDGSQEERTATTRHLVYTQAIKDSTANVKKGFFSRFSKKADPLDDFFEKEIEVGLRNDSRIEVMADFDTTTVLVLDAEKMFKDKEAKKNGKKGKNAEAAAPGK